ncbi:hypothetical protein [Alkaliphilus sp. B6464]|uniref:hypothetical protein n=1 Tax=Alkaliphilus sp. B6464 TaxID=2731219 RepID=UPI001BA5F344|nr:hypothetical protein [Alkaliphilus sp. B6464]QUH21948.1 hypothetical protein HYG84_18755 [Alkaliphilus sp. B6464]
MKNRFKNRKERIDFLTRKLGFDYVSLMVSMTDGQVKKHTDKLYSVLKDKEDFKIRDKGVPCMRCDSEVLWASECNCGTNRAVFDETMWIEDIENNSEHLKQDIEFAKCHGIEL